MVCRRIPAANTTSVSRARRKGHTNFFAVHESLDGPFLPAPTRSRHGSYPGLTQLYPKLPLTDCWTNDSSQRQSRGGLRVASFISPINHSGRTGLAAAQQRDQSCPPGFAIEGQAKFGGDQRHANRARATPFRLSVGGRVPDHLR